MLGRDEHAPSGRFDAASMATHLMATAANDLRLLRSARAILADPNGIAPALARAFLEERRLILVSNQRLLDAADQADAGVVADLRRKLAEHSAELSFDLIQHLLGAQQPSARRKGKGVVYTPRHVVEAVCARVVKLSREAGGDPASPEWKALDPAMGAGAFLLGMAEFLRRETGERPSDIIARRLYGADISSRSVETAELLLNLWALDSGDDASRISTNLRVGNSLDGAELRGEFGVGDGFGAVIGNPPYVRIQNIDTEARRQIRETWRSATTGSVDLYMPFIEMALREIGDTGIVGYIVPNTFTHTRAGQALRELLTRSGAVSEMYDFDHHPVFRGVATYACLLYLSRERRSHLKYVRATSGDCVTAEPDYGLIPYARLNSDRWELVTDEAHPVVHALESTGRPLGSMARIGVGLATLADACYLLDGVEEDGLYVKETDAGRFLIEPGVTQAIVKASTLKTEADILQARTRIIFPYEAADGATGVIPQRRLRREFPEAHRYLEAVRDKLDARDRGKPNPAAWYAFGRSQGIRSNFGRKLVTSGLNLASNFLLCDDPSVTFYAGYCVQTDAEDLRVLQKILNSPLMDFYIHQTSRSYQHGYKSYAKAYTRRFAIPHLRDAEREFVLAVTDPAELASMLLGKHGIDLDAHATIRAFLEESPKMGATLPAYDATTPPDVNESESQLW
jgi:adenine-specific DNA-methyltransferase